jgi:colanic acid biosynthesis glycosyl transferase WcaI
MIKRGWFTRLLYRLEAFAYAKAERVSGISVGMIDMFRQKSVPSRKVLHFPNGVTLPDPEDRPSGGAFRSRHGISSDTFLYVYSGNLGVKQGLDTLVEAARILQSRTNGMDDAPPIKVVICGDGVRREVLAGMARDFELRNVLFLPLQPDQQYLEMLADMDCCLLPQQQGTGSFFFPSKLLQALSMAKPVLAIADESSALVREALQPGGFGVCVPPGEPALLAETLEKLPSDPTRLRQMGVAGRRFVEKFEITDVLTRFNEQLGHVSRDETRRKPKAGTAARWASAEAA